MAQFRKAVITIKGLALIQKTQMRNIKLEFSKIVTGAGEYTETEELGNLAGLKDPKQEFPFSSVSVMDEQTVKLVSVLSNADLTKPYYMREIGVFAVDPDEGDILYSLAVAYPGKADYLPAFDGTVPVTIGIDTYQSVTNAENVSIRADPGAYASAQDLDEVKGKLKLIEKQLTTLSRGAVKVGPKETELNLGDTLFVVDNMVPQSFMAAAYSNIVFSDNAPNTEYWAETRADGSDEGPGGAGEDPQNIIITNGKLAVSQEQDVPADAAFLAKINS